MMAQAFSLNENAAAVADKSHREMAAAKALADAQSAANAKVAQANYDHTKSEEINSQIRLRSAR